MTNETTGSPVPAITNNPLKKLLADAAANRPREVTFAQLGDQLGGVSRKTVQERLSGESLMKIGELEAYAHVLGIEPLDMIKALFPGQKPLTDTITALRRNNVVMEDQVRSLRAGDAPRLHWVDELTRGGRWAVSILPILAGPTDSALITATYRLAVSPVYPLAPGDTARKALVREFGDLICRYTNFLSSTTVPLPATAVAGDTVHLNVPVFAADRDPVDAPVTLPGFPLESIAVVATTDAVKCSFVAAIVARALGWGLQNTLTHGVKIAPIHTEEPLESIEATNKIRNDGLRQLLTDAPKRTVVHHRGRAVLGDTPEQHALVHLAADDRFRDRLPFIVLLREDERIIERQPRITASDHGVEQWRSWRDELSTAVQSLPQGRAMILDISPPWIKTDEQDTPPADPTERLRAEWERHTRIAETIIRQILNWGGAGMQTLPSNIDPLAQRLLAALQVV